MSNDLVYILCVWLGLASFLCVWFHTDIAVHIWRWVFKHLRDKDKNDGFWPEEFHKNQIFDRNQWTIWINVRSPYYGELLTCPWCLSVRMTVALAVICLPLWPGPESILLALLGGPFVGNFLFKHS